MIKQGNRMLRPGTVLIGHFEHNTPFRVANPGHCADNYDVVLKTEST